MVAKIYRPAKTAMQSGTANTKKWMLKYTPEKPRDIDPLMGWTSSSDMKSQIRLKFASKEEAIAYAESKGIEYRVEEPRTRKRKPKQYASNFKYGRQGSWTH